MLMYKLAAARGQIDVERASLILEKTLYYIKDRYTYVRIKTLLDKADRTESDTLKRKYIRQAAKALYSSYKKHGLAIFDTAHMRESDFRQVMTWLALVFGILLFPPIPPLVLGTRYIRKKLLERRLRKLMER